MAKTQQVILLSPNQYLEHLLWTIGIPYQIMESDALKKDYPLWICQTPQELELVQSRHPHQYFIYLPSIEHNRTPSPRDKLIKEKKLQSWAADQLPFYSGIEGLDWIGSRIKFEAHPIWSAFDDSLCFQDRTFYWGLPLEEIFQSQKVTSKAFFHQTNGNRLPHEEVSALSKGELIILFRESIRYLLRKSDQSLSTYPPHPPGYAGVFLWKVDTDGADLQSLTHYVETLNQHQIRGSFFLDLEPLQDQQVPEESSSTFSDHEWNLHCLEHRAYQVRKNSRYDLKDGQSSGLYFLNHIPGEHLQASSAPYGVHPQFLSQLQQELDFKYASEFGWAYQSWPLQVQADQSSQHQWQVPFHPICPQSLDTARYSTQSKLSYFKNLAQIQISQGLPVAWYDHPSHKDPDFLQQLLKLAQSLIQGENELRRPLKVMTSGEYLNWWIHERPQLETIENLAPHHKMKDSHFNLARQFNFRRWKQDKLRKHVFRRKQ